MYYDTMFSLVHIHKWDGEFIENLIPYELTVYLLNINKYEDEREAKLQKELNKRK